MATSLRVLILTQYFPPEMGAPQGRLVRMGTGLKDRGWEVEVLTALPNYPTGRVFDGYPRWRPVREIVGSLDTLRIPLFASQSPSTIPRMTCYLSFAASALVHAVRSCKRPDLIWVESPPLFLAAAARLLAWWWRVPYVMNVSDLWPESFVHMGRLRTTDLSYRLMKRLEHWCYKGALGITGQSNEIVRFIQRLVPDTDVELITNGVDTTQFGPEKRDLAWRAEAGWEGKMVFVYAGLHGLAQGLEQILQVADQLRNRSDILFALIGDGPVKEELQGKASERNLENVRFYPSQPRERIPSILASADVAFITLGMPIVGAVPSKIYEAMASGLPILLVASGEAAERVENAGAGLICSPGNIDGAMEAVAHLADNVSLRQSLARFGRLTAENLYSHQKTATELDDFLRRLLKCIPESEELQLSGLKTLPGISLATRKRSLPTEEETTPVRSTTPE